MSQTDMINMALDLLEETPMISAEDSRPAVRFMRRNYGPTRDALLRRHPWNFALRRVLLPALADAPAFGWKRAFQLPGDCLRILPLADLGDFNGRYVPFVLEGKQILTNAGAPLRIQYIAQIEDDTTFDAQFTEVLSLALAVKGASLITGKQSYAERLLSMQNAAMSAAQLTDALEGTPENPSDDDWVDGRFTGVIA